MATTSIHAITQTIEKSVEYCMSDKIEAVLKDDLSDSINYAINDKTGEVTYVTLSSTLWCFHPGKPVDDFKILMATYGEDEIKYGNSRTKNGEPVVAWHLIQSFDGEVDPRIANEIGRKLAEELFPKHPAVISTHTNTGNTHNHIEFCAWNLDGKKYNYNHAAYDKIRKCSDRLCDEYGLSVLEHTRQQKLVKWFDKEGKLHYYEPTDRKNELINKRKAGELTTDDVNSFRNTMSYELSEVRIGTNAETVKQALDRVLPYATSYEHLLAMMRELGFKVKDKKKNGDWLSHITFTPPTADKGVRDSSIDKDHGFYTRKNLISVIEKQNAERKRNEMLQAKLQLPHYEEYVYGEIDVQNINEEYRADFAQDGGIKIVKRGEAEKSILRDIKKSDRELVGLYDTTKLRQLVEEQRKAAERKQPAQKREEILVRQIQEGFENLRFIERKRIYSYAQINEIVKGLWEQYNSCLSQIGRTEDAIDKLESAAKAPETLKEIRDRMTQGKESPEYMMERYPQDVKLMRSCMDIMKKYNVTDINKQKELQASATKFRERIDDLQMTLRTFSDDLAAYDRCVATLERIDRSSGSNHEEALAEYENIIKSGQDEARGTKAKKKQKGYER